MLNTLFLLDASHGSHSSLSELLSTHLGKFGSFLDEVVLHALIEGLRLLPFLFLTYLLMEFIEHKAADKTRALMSKAGSFGPLIGGALGALPQCGFSAAAANLRAGRVVTMGTLVAVFLSTSDEMLPILIAGNIKFSKILLILVYKIVVAVLVGFVVDLVLRLVLGGKEEPDIDCLCEEAGCHCEEGIVRSAVHHTVSTSLFILVITLALNALIFALGEQRLSELLPSVPVISHLVCAIVGLIPNCAVSVALTKFALSGIISTGAMLSGLFSGAGVGLLILLRVNKRKRENAAILCTVVLSGVIFGALADLLPFVSL